MSISNKIFCFTGKIETINPETNESYTRNQVKEIVLEHDGIVKSSITQDLDYLVQIDPESSSKKSLKAKELGVKIISEKQFFEMLDD